MSALLNLSDQTFFVCSKVELDDSSLPRDGSHAKPYQVKQVRNIILKNKLGGDPNEI
jgi:hypothetical protein